MGAYRPPQTRQVRTAGERKNQCASRMLDEGGLEGAHTTKNTRDNTTSAVVKLKHGGELVAGGWGASRRGLGSQQLRHSSTFVGMGVYRLS